MTIQTAFSTDPNAIVTVKVSVVEAPTPNSYQQTGAFVTFGGSNLAALDTAQLTQYSDLAALIPAPYAITTAVWAIAEVTVTATLPTIPGVAIGDVVNMLIAGFDVAAYNGMFPCTITGANTFTYPIVTNPGVAAVMGTFQFMTSVELQQMATTYFAQGNQVGVNVLELGYESSLANQVTALDNWLASNPVTVCAFLLPRAWGADAAAITAIEPLLKKFQFPEAMEYFFLTVDPSVITTLGPTYKDVIQFVEAPSVTDVTQPSPNILSTNGEFSAAAMFYNAIVYSASNTNRVSPMAFKFLYGVTKYPTKNNGPLLKSFKAANTNYVSSGYEGGISFTMVYQGVTLDGQDYFNWWYTIDWVQINVNLNLSNAIINGSNNPLAPLNYNQAGIDTLESTLFNTMLSASSFGMVLGNLIMTQYDGSDLTAAIAGQKFAGACNVNAVPFTPYTTANPGHYKIGEYDGLSTLFIPARGFIHILVNVVASNIVVV